MKTTKTTTRTSNAAAKTGKDWESLTDAELAKAVELLVTPADLTIRGAALALLAAFSYTPEFVRETLNKGEYFNAGPVFYGLDSTEPAIYLNNGTLTPAKIKGWREREAKPRSTTRRAK